LNERLPDPSSLTRIRQRWGAERFRRIFERTVRDWVKAGLAKGEVVHVDASLVRADVGRESLAERYVASAAAENDEAETARKSRKTGKFKKVCITDPDAGMATSGRRQRLEPSYKQHGTVDDECGVILDVEITTGEITEGQAILERLDAAAQTTGAALKVVTAAAGYAYAKVFGGLERREIAAVIPTKKEPIRSPVPLHRFRSDARHDIVKCPRGKTLKPGRRRCCMEASEMRGFPLRVESDSRLGWHSTSANPPSRRRRLATASRTGASTTVPWSREERSRSGSTRRRSPAGKRLGARVGATATRRSFARSACARCSG